jgi:hypothetical protein
MKKLGGGRMKAADYEFPRKAARVPVGTTLEDVTSPGFWQNYPNEEVGTELTVVADDFSLDVRLRILDIDPLRTHVRVLDVYAAPDADTFDGEVSQEVEGLSVKWGGRHGKWRVIKDGDVLEGPFNTKEEAEERMEMLAAG